MSGMNPDGSSARAIAVCLVVALVWLPVARVSAQPRSDGGPSVHQTGACIGLERAAALRAARSAFFDLERLDPRLDGLDGIAEATALLAKAARDQPDELRSFVRAFGRDASDAERRRMLDRLEKLGFKQAGDRDPVAVWGVIAVVAIALLVGSGCDGQGGCGSTDCTDPEGPCGGSSSGSDTD